VMHPTQSYACLCPGARSWWGRISGLLTLTVSHVPRSAHTIPLEPSPLHQTQAIHCAAPPCHCKFAAVGYALSGRERWLLSKPRFIPFHCDATRLYLPAAWGRVGC